MSSLPIVTSAQRHVLPSSKPTDRDMPMRDTVKRGGAFSQQCQAGRLAGLNGTIYAGAMAIRVATSNPTSQPSVGRAPNIAKKPTPHRNMSDASPPDAVA
jgi:hypothetical protein